MLIRESNVEDAKAFLTLRRQLDAETRFMLLEPEERKTTETEQRDRIQSTRENDNQIILVVEDAGEMIGFMAAIGGGFQRNRHCVSVGIGLKAAYTGKGIGTKLFRALDDWALKQGVHRLELTVMSHNQAGVGLYRKMGFVIEGVKMDSLFVDGQYVDEYYMAKLL